MTASTQPRPASELLLAAGVWSEQGNWYLYKDQKYWHKDIEMIADLRRAGIVTNTNPAHQLKDEALENFVRRCLDTEDYRVLGTALEEHDYEFLKKLGSNGILLP